MEGKGLGFRVRWTARKKSFFVMHFVGLVALREMTFVVSDGE
jgi:hypothetical protein